MRRRLTILLGATLISLTACVRPAAPPTVVGEPSATATSASRPATAPAARLPDQWPALRLAKVAGGLEKPLYLTAAGRGRVAVVEKVGRIRLFEHGEGRSLAPVAGAPLLDIRSKVSRGGEQGLLGLAIPPGETFDHFYVDYTDRGGDTVIARYSMKDALHADPASEKVVLKVHQPYANHNGGCLQFGPDGWLYVGMGDGGSAGDPQGHAQDPKSLLGKLLRIDVERGGAKPQVWALGLRNPWRFSFDRQTGDLWIGDVGQNAWEEIDFQPAGSAAKENFGWNRYEGTHPYPPGAPPFPPEGLSVPMIEYPHPTGESVTGGYVYRGSDVPGLQGMYLYADYVTGRVWGLRPQPPESSYSVPVTRLLLDTASHIASFGEDDAGELYVCDLDGAVYAVEAR